jgi:cytochrome P450
MPAVTGNTPVSQGEAMDQVDQIEAPVAYNPFEPGHSDDPYPQYRKLREADPVHASPLGVWLLFAYDDIHRLLRDPALSVEERHAHPTPLSELADSVRGDDEDERGGLAMLNRDPPDHTRLRRLVSKAFTPRTIQQLRPRIQALVDTALGEAERQGGIELIGQYAFTLPFAVITELLGMPDTDTDQLREWSGTLVRGLEPVVDPDTLRAVDAAGDNMHGLIVEAIAGKRRSPADDLLSALIAAEENGDVLSDDELAEQVMLLYVAGHETTVNLIGNGVLALLRHPDQLAALRDDPALITSAVDELLRYDSPVQMSRRVTLVETTVGGRTIEPGAFVVLGLASANRDPAHFGVDADRLDLARARAGEHLSFGGGHHYCLGASLARLEGQIAIGSLVQRFGRIEATAEPVWNGRINLRGLERLPLTLAR